jgi:hypothetical protein
MSKSKNKNLKLVEDAPKAKPSRDITLTDRQVELLVEADRGVAMAQERMNLVFTGVCAAAGIEKAEVQGLDGNTLTVVVHD